MSVSTTWTDPSTLDRTAGQTLPAANWEAALSGLYALGGSTGHIASRAHTSGTQSVNDSTQTALSFDTNDFDSDPTGSAIHSTGVNPTRFTCRTAGTYLLTGNANFATNGTGYRRAFLYLNGGTIIADVSHNAGGTIGDGLTVSTIYNLAAGDYVELMVIQSSGGALNVSGSMSMAKV